MIANGEPIKYDASCLRDSSDDDVCPAVCVSEDGDDYGDSDGSGASSDETGDDTGGEDTEAEVSKDAAEEDAANAKLDTSTAHVPAGEVVQRRERERELGMDFGGREFSFTLPGGVTERFSTCQAALQAYKCFFLLGGHRPDLAKTFTTTGKFAHVNGARVLQRKFIRLLRKEGLTVDAAAWAQFRTDATTSVVCARAYDDPRFARHCRAAVRQGLSQALPHAHAIKTAGRILLGME